MMEKVTTPENFLSLKQVELNQTKYSLHQYHFIQVMLDKLAMSLYGETMCSCLQHQFILIMCTYYITIFNVDNWIHMHKQEHRDQKYKHKGTRTRYMYYYYM